MKLNKLFITFVIVLSTVFMTGCANIEFIRAIDATNTVVDRLVIELDESKINKAGQSLDTVMSAINNDMITFRNSVSDWKLKFSDYPNLLNLIDNGIKVEVALPKSNQIYLTIQFSSWDMFGLFYGYSEIEDFEYTSVMSDVGPFVDEILAKNYGQENYGLFLIKYFILKNAGIVDDLETFEYSGVNYYEKYKSLLNNHYNIDDVKVSEIFAYPDDRLYSNADEKEIQANMTLLRWNLDGKSKDFEMEIYKLYPNTTIWYVLALVISAIVVTILIVVYIKKSKNEHTREITKKEVEDEK